MREFDFIENAEDRAKSYFKKWLDNPASKTALHRPSIPARGITPFVEKDLGVADGRGEI